MRNNYSSQNSNSIWIEELGNRKLRFHYLNGDIDFDESVYGAWVMSSGCGSGKTTNIRNLIGMRWYEGILYVAFTISEVNEMYKWIVDNLVGKTSDPNTGNILKLEDIVVLHSDTEADGVDMNLFRNHPELLADKRIILCTHHKLLNEPTEVLVSSKFNKRSASRLHSKSRCIINGLGQDHPRQWILIDESTEANGRSYTIPISTFAMLGEAIYTERVFRNNKYITVDLKEPKLVRKNNMYMDFVDLIEMSSKAWGVPVLPINPNNEINRIKFNQLADELYYNFDRYANICKNSKNKIAKVQFNYTNMINQGMVSHLILFDGTGDITLKNSKKFNVLGMSHDKYNSSLTTFKFDFNLFRKIDRYKLNNGLNEYITSELGRSINTLADIIRNNRKTLIFTWKNFKYDNTEINDDMPSQLDITDNSSIIKDKSTGTFELNPDFDLSNYLRFELYKKGILPDQFAVEYYGSGKDKAVNEYREFDSIVFLGNYQVPNYVIDDFNTMFESSISFTEYYANRVIQAICRGRIRKHNGEGMNIYFSSDWSDDVINYSLNYLTGSSDIHNTSTPNISKNTYERLREIGITPKKAEKIAKLCEYDERILTAIERNTIYTVNIKLDKIYELIPMSRKEVDKYSYLKDLLAKYGIILNII